MIYRIHHSTEYLYSRPVLLAPHILRLRPRNDGTQRLLRFHQAVKPEPVGRTEFSDLEGNPATQVWFEGSTTSLAVLADFEVETLRGNPFDFIITDPGLLNLPIRYSDELEPYLAPYVMPMHKSNAVADFAREAALLSSGATLDFLRVLNTLIFERITPEFREWGEAQAPEATLQRGAGACRDVAILFMEACRHQGLATRFVSGYWDGTSKISPPRLHAWAEVYLPGGGWRGYDPSKGLATAENHIPVASGIRPPPAAPITGSFWGAEASSSMKIKLTIQREGGGEV